MIKWYINIPTQPELHHIKQTKEMNVKSVPIKTRIENSNIGTVNNSFERHEIHRPVF